LIKPHWNPDLKPEKSKNIEASLKYVDNSSSISLTAYQNTIKDYIIYDYISWENREIPAILMKQKFKV
jgi:outer membrane receptor protein involved in Fe transport